MKGTFLMVTFAKVPILKYWLSHQSLIVFYFANANIFTKGPECIHWKGHSMIHVSHNSQILIVLFKFNEQQHAVLSIDVSELLFYRSSELYYFAPNMFTEVLAHSKTRKGSSHILCLFKKHLSSSVYDARNLYLERANCSLNRIKQFIIIKYMQFSLCWVVA